TGKDAQGCAPLRQAANSILRSEPVRAKDLSPGRRALGPGRQLNQPRNGAKDAPEPGFLRPVPGLTRPARGSQCWRTVLAHWAMLLRPSDLGRGRIVAACEESKAQ